MIRVSNFKDVGKLAFSWTLLLVWACSTSGTPTQYHDPVMDFGAIRTVAVLPFANLTRDKLAAERVRDTFMTSLLTTGAVYVMPPGEVARGLLRAGVANPVAPSAEEIAKLAAIIKMEAVITGVVREYGEVRSGSIAGNVVSFSLEMMEVQTGRVVWAASSTKGGISMWDRFLGSGGRPMNDVTKAAVDDIINKLFR